jgi:hypothetical protein
MNGLPPDMSLSLHLCTGLVVLNLMFELSTNGFFHIDGRLPKVIIFLEEKDLSSTSFNWYSNPHAIKRDARIFLLLDYWSLIG